MTLEAAGRSEAPDEPPLVVATWNDAWLDSEDNSAASWKDACPVKTVGYLVRSTTSLISLAAELFPDSPGDYRNTTHIPRAMVTAIEYPRGNT